MLQKIFISFIFIICLISCSKKDALYEPKPKVDPYQLYKEGLEAFEKADYFYAEKNSQKLNLILKS